MSPAGILTRAAEIAEELKLFAADEFAATYDHYREQADYTDPSPEAQIACFIADELYELKPKLDVLIQRLAKRQAEREAAEAEDEADHQPDRLSNPNTQRQGAN